MKILLALDTSPASQVALEEIAARSWPADSSFEVVSVIEPSHLWTTPEVAQEAAYTAGEVVSAAVQQLQTKYRATAVVLSGDAKREVLDRARSTGADFVIIGSHGASLARFLWGNVASSVLRYAPCSVEIVRGKTGNAARGKLKVLLATDGSPCSELAARSIAERPWPAGTEVRILTAVELLLPATRSLLEPPLTDTAFIESARAEAMKRAQDAIAQATRVLSGTGLSVSESISVLLNSPKDIILDEAARWGADLIVLGSHGSRGVVGRFLIGSVSEAVATHAGCSVEIIRKVATVEVRCEQPQLAHLRHEPEMPGAAA